MTLLPETERTFFFDALQQLAPPDRQVFVARLAEYLQAHADPGPGDIDRALRASLHGLWTPPEVAERPARWERTTPAFDRVSKRAF
jgi:hypothetical protein